MAGKGCQWYNSRRWHQRINRGEWGGEDTHAGPNPTPNIQKTPANQSEKYRQPNRKGGA